MAASAQELQSSMISLLSDESLSALKLHKQPFLDIDSVEQYYMTQSIEMVIKIVYQHLSEDNMTLLIKGEHGSGKSAFLKLIQASAAEQLVFTTISAKEKTNSAALLTQTLPQELQQQPLDSENTTKQAALHFFKQMAQAKQPVLIIDNAHKIPFKVLATLFKFLRAISNQGRGRVKLMLLGENAIDKNLDGIESRLLDKSSIFSTLLRPYNRQQTEEYLRFKLSHAGYIETTLPINEKQLDEIHKASGGVPAYINYEFINQLEHTGDKSTIMEKALNKLSLSK